MFSAKNHDISTIMVLFLFRVEELDFGM